MSDIARTGFLRQACRYLEDDENLNGLLNLYPEMKPLGKFMQEVLADQTPEGDALRRRLGINYFVTEKNPVGNLRFAHNTTFLEKRFDRYMHLIRFFFNEHPVYWTADEFCNIFNEQSHSGFVQELAKYFYTVGAIEGRGEVVAPFDTNASTHLYQPNIKLKWYYFRGYSMLEQRILRHNTILSFREKFFEHLKKEFYNVGELDAITNVRSQLRFDVQISDQFFKLFVTYNQQPHLFCTITYRRIFYDDLCDPADPRFTWDLPCPEQDILKQINYKNDYAPLPVNWLVANDYAVVSEKIKKVYDKIAAANRGASKPVWSDVDDYQLLQGQDRVGVAHSTFFENPDSKILIPNTERERLPDITARRLREVAMQNAANSGPTATTAAAPVGP